MSASATQGGHNNSHYSYLSTCTASYAHRPICFLRTTCIYSWGSWQLADARMMQGIALKSLQNRQDCRQQGNLPTLH